MSVCHCRHCNTLLTPGAPFCLACFLPIEDETPAAAPAAAAPAPSLVAVGAGTSPVESGPVPEYGGNDFFAAPLPSAPHDSTPWQPPTPIAMAPRRRSSTAMVVAALVGVLALVGGFVGVRWMFSSPSEERTIATAFREARPPDFVPVLPDLGTLAGDDDDTPEGPGAAKAFVAAIDVRLRGGSDALLETQAILDRWADGNATDDDVRAAIKTLNKRLAAAVSTDLVMQAPPSTRRGLGKLTESAMEYRLALGALEDWLDTRGSGSRITYRLSVGGANAHWDEGIIAVYRAAGMPAPPLPHPAKG